MVLSSESHLRTVISLAVLLSWSSNDILAYLDRALPMNGPVTAIIGYGATNYQAIRYEPLCGTLDDHLTNPFSIGHCDTAMQVYSNNTKDTVALYDETGVRLKGAIVGGGIDLCMCFALSSTSQPADLCWWVGGDGQADIWWSLQLDHVVGGAFRPGAAKSLPHCGDINLDAVKQSWSATAVQPSNTESVKQVGATTTTSTFTPSVVDYTTTIPTTMTLPDGSVTVSTVTATSHLPVVTAEGAGGLTRSEKIALGVGLGVGIPSLIIAVIGIMVHLQSGAKAVTL